MLYSGVTRSKEITMSDEPDAYQTYILRLWRARCHGEWQWRVSLESPYKGERLWFTGLESLFVYLNEQCDRQAPTPSEAPDT
jgi:hypothetical protein